MTSKHWYYQLETR